MRSLHAQYYIYFSWMKKEKERSKYFFFIYKIHVLKMSRINHDNIFKISHH